MDKALKQRLVGASVLIAMAVVVLPMLLSGRPEGGTQETRKIELPSEPPELSFETRRYPIGEQTPQGQGEDSDNETAGQPTQLPAPRNTVREPGPADENQAASGSQLEPVEVSGGDDQSVPARVPGQQPGPDMAEPVPVIGRSAASSGRYIVQVASFGAVDNANRLSAVLSESGYSVMTDSVKSEVGTLHRVRVGPFDTEAEANQAAATVEARISGVKPRVMDLQPEQTAPVTAPADPLVRWVVQVGSFSAEANAGNLVSTLRQKGLSAYQETVNSSGSEIYRVRIGPFLDREEAMRTERRIRESMSLTGVVMSTD
jgi:DedD protein